MIQRLFPCRQIPMSGNVLCLSGQRPCRLAERELKAGAVPLGQGAELLPRTAVLMPDVGWADRSAARYGRG